MSRSTRRSTSPEDGAGRPKRRTGRRAGRKVQEKRQRGLLPMPRSVVRIDRASLAADGPALTFSATFDDTDDDHLGLRERAAKRPRLESVLVVPGAEAPAPAPEDAFLLYVRVAEPDAGAAAAPAGDTADVMQVIASVASLRAFPVHVDDGAGGSHRVALHDHLRASTQLPLDRPAHNHHLLAALCEVCDIEHSGLQPVPADDAEIAAAVAGARAGWRSVDGLDQPFGVPVPEHLRVVRVVFLGLQ